VKKQPVQGQDLTEPHANSNTKKELLKRARQLGVVGRSGMTKAQLVEAIARKEIDESSATSSASHSSSLAPAQHEAESAAQQVRDAVWKAAQEDVQSAAQQARDAVWKTVREEMQAATQQMQAAMRGIAQPVARQVRDTVQAVVRQEAQSAAEQVRGTVHTVVRQEMQAAAQQVRGTVQSIVRQEMQAGAQQAQETIQAVVRQEMQAAAHETREVGHTTAEDRDRNTLVLQPLRASQPEPESWLRRIGGGVGRTLLLPIVIALLTSILTSQYISSRIVDKTLLGSSDPVSTKLFFDRDNGIQGLTWALPGPLGQLSLEETRLVEHAAGRVDEFNSWIRNRGGVDVHTSLIKLIVTGQRQTGVVITDMRAKIDECGPPLTGTLLYGPPEGERENTQIAFNLDENPPVAREIDPKKNFGDPGYLGQDYFKSHTIPLGLGEDQVFSILAMTSNRYCKWYIDLELFVSGNSQHIEIGYKPGGDKEQKQLEITALIDFQAGSRGSFAAYRHLYVVSRGANPAGFAPADPQTYIP
jgi:hypothetical protein